MAESPDSAGEPGAARDRQRQRAAALADVRAIAWAALAIVSLLVLASAQLWWPEGRAIGWWSTLAAVLLAAAAIDLLRRLAQETRSNAEALGRFAQRLREGDVAGALRAVRAESPQASSAWGTLDEVSRPPAAGPASSLAPPSSVLGESASRFGIGAREVELALGERERRWQARMRLSADWHWETDESLRITWVSQDLASLVKLGVQPEDLLGKRFDTVAPFHAPAGGWEPVLERLVQRKPLRELTIEVERRGRSPVWVALSGRPHVDDQGRFTGYEGVGRDVTEQRLAHERLAESERRHAMMAELAADWFWQTDALHRIVEVGPMARQMLGERAAQVAGHTRWELFGDGASDAEWDAHRADLDAHRPFRGFEYALRGANRTLRWVSIAGLPRVDAEGRFIGYHGVGRDITLKKRAERLLLTRNEQLERLVAERTAELEQSNHDLEAFARQLAHELRTPIGQVAGLSDLLKNKAWERKKETNYQSDKILAEIVHIPESRTGNVLRRPVFRDYEIPYLSNSGVSTEYQIGLDDLMVSIKNDTIVLRSKKHNKEIIPCLSNAHNYSNKSLPIYHFFADLQSQNLKSIYSFSWGILETHYNYFPRVIYKDIILSKAKWSVNKKEIEPFYVQNGTSLSETFTIWLTKRNIPRFVNWVHFDNTLLIDFGKEIGIQLFLKSIQNHSKIVLEEFLFTEESVVKDKKGENYTNQIILSFYKEQPKI